MGVVPLGWDPEVNGKGKEKGKKCAEHKHLALLPEWIQCDKQLSVSVALASLPDDGPHPATVFQSQPFLSYVRFLFSMRQVTKRLLFFGIYTLILGCLTIWEKMPGL